MESTSKILSKLYHTSGPPRITTGSVLITSPNTTGANQKLSRLAEDIKELVSRSEFHISSSPSKHVLTEIILDGSEPRTNKPCIYAGYSGWRFHIRREPNQDMYSELEYNPITSLFVAGLVAAEVFKIRFSEEVPFQPMKVFKGSLMDNQSEMPPYPNSLDFQGANVSWFGCGSISNYAVHALDGISKANGVFHMVDPSTINNSNSRKYIGISSKNRKHPKAMLLSQVLKNRGLSTRSFQMSINEYARKVDFKIPLAISAIDSSVGRRDLQAKLPRIILNGWTGGFDQALFAGVGRHSFDGKEECLNCAYWTDIEGTPNFVDLAPHLNTNSMNLYEKWRDGMPLPQTGKRTYVSDERFLDGYINACRNYSVNTGSIQREFSIPFISAIGGSLLAMSIIFEGSPDHAPYRLYKRRLRFSIGPKFSSYGTEPTNARTNCICNDPVYRKVYSDMWLNL